MAPPVLASGPGPEPPKLRCGGSTPLGDTALWSNGNSLSFDLSNLGSNPGGAANRSATIGPTFHHQLREEPEVRQQLKQEPERNMLPSGIRS